MSSITGSRTSKWTDEIVERELRALAHGLGGKLPSGGALREMGRQDLASAVVKTGGFMRWADRLGIPRGWSDSDTGWQGEVAFAEMSRRHGLDAKRMQDLKAPFDLLVNGSLKVDVKSANYAEYGACRGWFYRIAKIPQADLVVLYQLDTGDFYGLPWFVCPSSNATIARNGGKYVDYRNNWPLVRMMLGWRMAERARLGSEIVADVA